jgi:hypothetical protein
MLSGEHLELSVNGDSRMQVGAAAVTILGAVVRSDDVINGIERLLVPRSVQEDFNHHRLAAIFAVCLVPSSSPRGHPPSPPGAHQPGMEDFVSIHLPRRVRALPHIYVTGWAPLIPLIPSRVGRSTTPRIC